MRAQDADVVRKLPLFKDVEDENFDSLIAAGYLQKFPQGVVLVHEGERADFLHVLVEGAIEFFATLGKQETTISLLLPPAAFILAAVVVDRVYLKSARTLAPSTVVLIPAAAVRDVFARDPAFARAVVVELANRYRDVVKDLKNQRLRTGVERLANWILVEEQRQGGRGELRVPFEKRVLANQLGMRPENLSRSLAELGKVGVTVSGPVITVRDKQRLAAFAQPHALIDGPEGGVEPGQAVRGRVNIGQ